MHSIRAFLSLCLAYLPLLAGVTRPAAGQTPVITDVVPSSAPVGATIAIVGANFDHSGTGTVWTGAVPYRVRFPKVGGFIDVVPVTVRSLRISVVVPVGAVSGSLKIVQGTLRVSESPGVFRVIKQPSIGFLNPDSGGVGSTVGLFGEHFDRDGSGNLWSGSVPYRVRFPKIPGSIDVVPTFVSATEIRAVVPAGAVSGRVSIVQGASVLTTSASNFTISPTLLRIVNQTPYDMITLTLNGVQQFAPGNGVLVGNTVSLPAQPGTFDMTAGVGFRHPDGTLDVWFSFRRTVTISAGSTSTQTFTITIGDLLTQGLPTRDWVSGLFPDGNGGFHVASFRFTSSGSWTFFVDGVQQPGGGVATLVLWPARSAEVQFSIHPQLPAATMVFPFGSFLLANGPPNARVLQYVMQ